MDTFSRRCLAAFLLLLLSLFPPLASAASRYFHSGLCAPSSSLLIDRDARGDCSARFLEPKSRGKVRRTDGWINLCAIIGTRTLWRNWTLNFRKIADEKDSTRFSIRDIKHCFSFDCKGKKKSLLNRWAKIIFEKLVQSSSLSSFFLHFRVTERKKRRRRRGGRGEEERKKKKVDRSVHEAGSFACSRVKPTR